MNGSSTVVTRWNPRTSYTTSTRSNDALAAFESAGLPGASAQGLAAADRDSHFQDLAEPGLEAIRLAQPAP